MSNVKTIIVTLRGYVTKIECAAKSTCGLEEYNNKLLRLALVFPPVA